MTALNPYFGALDRAARLWPARPAVWSGGAATSFAELRDQSAHLARWLRVSAGLGGGDRIADLRPNSTASFVTDFGATAADLVRVALNPANSRSEFRRQIELTGPRVLFAAAGFADTIGRDWLTDAGVAVVDDADFDRIACGGTVGMVVPAARQPPILTDAPLLAIRFTGGSTGVPKAVLRTSSQQFWVAACMLADLYQLDERDVYFHTQSLSVGAHAFVLPAILRGALQVVLPTFDEDQVLAVADDLGVTHLKCVPATLQRLVRSVGHGSMPRALRHVLYGASPASTQLLEHALDVFGPSVTMAQTYGQAEAPATISRLTVADHEAARAGRTERLATNGRPYSFTDVLVLSDDGKPLARGEVGEIAVRGPIVAQWRWLDGGLAPLRPADADHLTGDLGYLDADGYLHLTGRRADMLISGGYNVYPAEVEAVLHAHQLVEQACVVGVPSAEWGDEVAAAVVLKPGNPPDSADVSVLLMAHCRERLAKYKCPKRIAVVAALPLTTANKVSRREVAATVFDVH